MASKRMVRLMARYFTSDAHFGHFNPETNKSIITFERTQFKTIQEHNKFLVDLWKSWAKKLGPDDEFWFLGDFGDLSFLKLFDYFLANDTRTYFVLGNHDAAADIPEIQCFVNKVYQYPVYLSNKLVVSHEPVATWESVINVHGHLHSAILNSPNYINASVHVADYKMITEQNIAGRFSQLPKWNMRFLYEPYAEMYKFTQPKEDVVMDRNGRIDLSASRLLMKMNKNDPHQYKGGL